MHPAHLRPLLVATLTTLGLTVTGAARADLIGLTWVVDSEQAVRLTLTDTTLGQFGGVTATSPNGFWKITYGQFPVAGFEGSFDARIDVTHIVGVHEGEDPQVHQLEHVHLAIDFVTPGKNSPTATHTRDHDGHSDVGKATYSTHPDNAAHSLFQIRVNHQGAAPVPEPGTGVMIAVGITGLLATGRRLAARRR